MTALTLLTPAQWEILRRIRLKALKSDPRAFLATHRAEEDLCQNYWLSELRRGIWLVALSDDYVVGVLGATPEDDIDSRDRYLSYLWVEPKHRRAGLACRMVVRMLDDLRARGVRRAWLWVLQENEAARALYEKVGFTATGERQPLSSEPSRFEERMSIELS
jgi:ribosomal protein S18 acetylase RimI-like enzyme